MSSQSPLPPSRSRQRSGNPDGTPELRTEASVSMAGYSSSRTCRSRCAPNRIDLHQSSTPGPSQPTRTAESRRQQCFIPSAFCSCVRRRNRTDSLASFIQGTMASRVLLQRLQSPFFRDQRMHSQTRRNRLSSLSSVRDSMGIVPLAHHCLAV